MSSITSTLMNLYHYAYGFGNNTQFTFECIIILISNSHISDYFSNTIIHCTYFCNFF